MLSIIDDKSWYIDKISEQNWHYVSWTPYSIQALSGYASMSWVYAICMSTSGLSEHELCSAFRQIDTYGETGTFYPVANVTVMPSREYWAYSPEQLKQHLDDVKKAQALVNADCIYWDCRFVSERTKEALRAILLMDEYWCKRDNRLIV